MDRNEEVYLNLLVDHKARMLAEGMTLGIDTITLGSGVMYAAHIHRIHPARIIQKKKEVTSQ